MANTKFLPIKYIELDNYNRDLSFFEEIRNTWFKIKRPSTKLYIVQVTVGRLGFPTKKIRKSTP